MVTMLLAAAASLLTAPDFTGVISPNDFPYWATKQNLSAGALVDISVDRTGRITACRTISTVGSERLGNSICSIALRRRAVPASDSDGKAVPSRVTTMIKMVFWGPGIHDIVATSETPDVVLTVQRLPNGAPAVSLVVVLDVQPNGLVTNCVGARQYTNEALLKAACASLKSSTLEQKDTSRFVTTRRVEFTTGAQPPSPQPNNSAASPH